MERDEWQIKKYEKFYGWKLNFKFYDNWIDLDNQLFLFTSTIIIIILVILITITIIINSYCSYCYYMRCVCILLSYEHVTSRFLVDAKLNNGHKTVNMYHVHNLNNCDR